SEDVHRPVNPRNAATIASGGGGQPGTVTSTGTTSPTAPTTPYASANSPWLMAQSPTATTIAGSGSAATVRRSGSARLRVTGPVASTASAWRGEATSRAPYRSASCTGPNAEPISISHPLHEPASTCRSCTDPARSEERRVGTELRVTRALRHKKTAQN